MKFAVELFMFVIGMIVGIVMCFESSARAAGTTCHVFQSKYIKHVNCRAPDGVYSTKSQYFLQ